MQSGDNTVEFHLSFVYGRDITNCEGEMGWKGAQGTLISALD